MSQRQLDSRIAGKFAGDRFWSLAALTLLWLLYAFVFISVIPNAPNPEVVWALGFAGAMVLLFNAASIFVMVAHLSKDRAEIYGLDLHYLDLAKKRTT